jgi:hypothetical protein
VLVEPEDWQIHLLLTKEFNNCSNLIAYDEMSANLYARFLALCYSTSLQLLVELYSVFAQDLRQKRRSGNVACGDSGRPHNSDRLYLGAEGLARETAETSAWKLQCVSTNATAILLT